MLHYLKVSLDNLLFNKKSWITYYKRTFYCHSILLPFEPTALDRLIK